MLLPAASPAAQLDVRVEGLRSERGLVQVCLTAKRAHFPNCKDDPDARKLTLPTRQAHLLRFADLPAGDYALAMIHDENGNGKLDTRVAVPTEGVGFSNNPRLIFGPPGFRKAVFAVRGAGTAQTVQMKYFL